MKNDVNKPRFIRSLPGRFLLMLVAGFMVGLLTLLGQGLMPGQWNALVNSGAIWLAGGFFLSCLFNKPLNAVLGGLVVLVSEVAGYFLSAWLIYDIPTSLGGVLPWLAVAILGGPLSGIATHWWRQGRVWQRVAGVSFLSGVFVGEGTYYLLALKAEKGIAGVAMILVGVILSLLLGRNWRDRALNLITLPVIVLLVLGFYNLLNQIQF